DGLTQQRMDEIRRARPQTVPVEELAVDQTQDLAALGGREVVAVLQPGMAPPCSPWTARGSKRQPRDRPDRMSRPATDLGPVARLEPSPAPAAAPVDDRPDVRRLEEDGVSALTSQKPRRAGRLQPIRHIPVIGRIDPMKGRTQVPPQGC